MRRFEKECSGVSSYLGGVGSLQVGSHQLLDKLAQKEYVPEK